uniref:Uncharacterized protein n=1 Tax=Siphoviridae sp. ctxMM9 TaxID=2827973 RepID=A0A8S5T6P9_9CAUD|nr:MAG TPA: hypothetical protein [Siphoviridae sp. ctxMM9]
MELAIIMAEHTIFIVIKNLIKLKKCLLNWVIQN